MMKIAVYPGSFDPPTLGHLDVIKKASSIFDRVIVSVVENPNKKATFSKKERVRMLKKMTKGFKNVEVDTFKGLLVNYVKKKRANFIIRGLRAVSDFEYEFQMALINKKLNPQAETVWFLPFIEHIYISSSIVKEIAKYKGNISCLVPEEIVEDIRRKFK